MSRNYRRRTGAKKKPVEQSIVINEMHVQSADRSRKDIGTFKNSLQSAESVHNPNRTRLYDLYSDILIDGTISGVIDNKIIATILNKNLNYNVDGKHQEEFDKLIDSEVFSEVIKKIIEEDFWGVSGMEFIPGEKMEFIEVPRKHIKLKEKVLSKYQNSPESGVPYEDLDNVWILGKEGNFGKLLEVAPYALWKRGDMADWAQYVEIFGQPIRVTKYDAFDVKTRSELKKVMDEAGSSLSMLIPKQADFEIIDGKATNANGDLQKSLKAACDEEILIRLLGVSETTKASSSSGYAQSKEHGDQQDEVIKFKMKSVLNALNSDKFAGILKSYGYPVSEKGAFEYEKEINLEELKIRMEIDEKVSTKVPYGDDYWYDTYGVNKPENYEQLKKEMEERKQAALTPPTEKLPSEKEDPKKPKTKKPEEKPKNLSSEQEIQINGLWDKFRVKLADFFDPAP